MMTMHASSLLVVIAQQVLFVCSLLRRMIDVRKSVFGVIVAALSALLAANAALGQGDYPDKPIRILVGFPPGGPPDVAARLLAEKFAESWGKSVVVENVTGGGGNIAVDRVAKAAPDGATLVMASNAIVINPSLYEKMPYDAAKDLAPISLAVSMPIILVVNNDVPAKSVPELVALARAEPGKLTVGHAGVGTPAHLAGELFKAIAHVDVQQVPYRGIPVLLPDLLAGRLTMTFPNIAVALPLLRDGKLRALAVAAPRRAAPMPDLPTMAEQGFAGIDATAWFGLMAPAGTPPAIVEKLHRETVRILGTADVRKRLDDLGMEVIANTPGEFAAVIRTETPQWAKVIRDAGIKLSE
jgi:tripartite-type tricarboxylate transporter receptor subunit TctC